MEIYFRWPNRRSLWQYSLVVLTIANCIAIFLVWKSGSAYYLDHPAHGNIWFAYGRLAGLFAQFAFLLQLLLISRAPFIERPFGFDKLNAVHRWIGYSLAVFILAHPVLLTYGAARSNGLSLLGQFSDYLQNSVNVFNAFIGVVILLAVIVSSIAFFRKKVQYETWYFAHLLTYIGITLIFLHQIKVGDLQESTPWAYWLVLNIFAGTSVVLFRWVRPLVLLARHKFRIDRIVPETSSVWSIYLRGRAITRFRFEPGQYANLRFLSFRHWWQSHPFSFSAGPNPETIRFSIKASGDFTTSLGSLRPGTPVLVDGPLGQFVLSRTARHKVLLIAGGIGITPLRALLDDPHMAGRDPILLYANRTLDDIALRKEIEEFERHGQVRVIHFLNQPLAGYESGYIDHQKISQHIPDFFERDVFLCGPPPMMKAVVKQLRFMGVGPQHIHYERFSF